MNKTYEKPSLKVFEIEDKYLVLLTTSTNPSFPDLDPEPTPDPYPYPIG